MSVSTHHLILALSVVLSSARRLLDFSMSLMLISSWGNQVVTDLCNPSHPLYYCLAHLLINLQSAIVNFPHSSRLLVQVLKNTVMMACSGSCLFFLTFLQTILNLLLMTVLLVNIMSCNPDIDMLQLDSEQ